MIHDLKALGLVLMAMLAIGVVTAPITSAEGFKGWLTSDGPVKLTGTDTLGEKSKFTMFGQVVECHGHYTIGKINETPHGFISVAGTTVTSVTVAPDYSNCTAKIGESLSPATVTMNGCDYVMTLGNTIAGTFKYEVTTDIVCPEFKQIELHAYSNATHLTTICTYLIPAQTGRTGASAETIQEGGIHKITINGPAKGITVNRHGILCGGTAHTEVGELDFHSIIGGTNEAGNPTGVTVTD